MEKALIKPTQRLEYVDIMRGIAITLVVVGHIIQFNGIPMNNSVFEFIYSFHMPLFFAISGYVIQKVTKIESWRQYGVFLKKKIIAIAVPFLVWTLFIDNFVLKEQWCFLNIGRMIHQLHYPMLWYLKSLFFLLMAFGLYDLVQNKIEKRVPSRIIGSCAVFMLIVSIFVLLGIDEKYLLMYSVFFSGGAILAKYNRLEIVVMKDICYSMAFILFFILSTHWNFHGSWVDVVYKMAISILAFVVFLNFSQKIKMYEPVSDMFEFFGRESLAIYLMQFYLCHFCDVGAFQAMNPFALFAIAFLIAVPICYVCGWTSILIKRNRYLSLFLLGKSNVRNKLLCRNKKKTVVKKL